MQTSLTRAYRVLTFAKINVKNMYRERKVRDILDMRISNDVWNDRCNKHGPISQVDCKVVFISWDQHTILLDGANEILKGIVTW